MTWREADDTACRITRWRDMRGKLEAMLCELDADDRQTNTCLADALNALQEAGSALFMAEVAEECTLPDTSDRRSHIPGSH